MIPIPNLDGDVSLSGLDPRDEDTTVNALALYAVSDAARLMPEHDARTRRRRAVTWLICAAMKIKNGGV